MTTPICSVCQEKPGNLSCSRCKAIRYCGTGCQKADWPRHKSSCKSAGQSSTSPETASPEVPWYSKIKARKLRDGSYHEGELELVTWDSKSQDGEEVGWGGVIREEVVELKAKFEGEFGGDHKKLYKYWPQAYRWTCCGQAGDIKFGCDHHGRGSTPCKCDFCVCGQQIPDSIWNAIDQHRIGLNLARGPDPRSYNSARATVNQKMRATLGMPM